MQLTITEAAVEKLRYFAEKQGKDKYGLKVDVYPGGCAGFQYAMDLVEAPGPEDQTLTSNGVNVYVQKTHASLLDGIKIDYVDNIMGGGFSIDNPNAKSACGCGHSFTA